MDEAQITAIVVGVTEIIKGFGIPSKYIPVVAVVIGAITGTLFSYRDGIDLLSGLMKGLVIGLTTTGIYKAIKQ